MGRLARQCVWPLGCGNRVDIGRVCFDHFVMTEQEWRDAATQRAQDDAREE